LTRTTSDKNTQFSAEIELNKGAHDQRTRRIE